MIARLLVLLAAIALLPEAAFAQDKGKAVDDARETLSAIVRVRAKIVPNARSVQLKELTLRSIDRIEYFRTKTSY